MSKYLGSGVYAALVFAALSFAGSALHWPPTPTRVVPIVGAAIALVMSIRFVHSRQPAK